MYSHQNRSAYNEYYSPPSRLPQTNSSRLQGSHVQRQPSDSYYLSGQSPRNRKEYGLFSRRYLPKEPTAVNRSRMSQNASMSMTGAGMMPEDKLFSEEMLFLLSEEENNLKFFKEKIEGEKERVVRDFANVKKQLQHILQDLQMSFIAQLDVVYKEFIGRYQAFKGHMANLRDIRKNLIEQAEPNQFDYLAQLTSNKGAPSSNRDMIADIQKDAAVYRSQKVYNQIAQLQKEHVVPAREVADEIICMGNLETQYYDESATTTSLNSLSEALKKQAQEIFPEIKDNLIKTAETVIAQQQEGKTQNVLNSLTQYEPQPQQRSHFKSADHKDVINSFVSPKKDNHRLLEPERDVKRVSRPVSSKSDADAGLGTFSKYSKREDSRGRGSKGRRSGNAIAFRVGPEQQNVCAEWLEDMALREVSQISAGQNVEAMLCGIFACEGRVIVTGGKDRVLRIYQVSSGRLLYVLTGHQANICSLSNHGSFIASGGDHGCSSLILWDVKSWSMKSRFQLHSAAVTGIVDLQDSTHLATASYDKKINIVNHRKSQAVLTAHSAKTGIACMGLCGDRQRLVVSCLDNSIGVWRIRREGTAVSGLELEKQFVNESLVSALRPLSFRNSHMVAGTKDGRLQLINCFTGETVRKLSIGTTAVAEVLVFERQKKPENPLVVSCVAREKALILTRLDTGMNSLLDVRGRLNVEIGCGIGPKVIVSEGGLVAMVSQSALAKQILIYQLTLQ